MSIKISITGLKEIDNVVKGLPLLFQDRVLKNAHADAAKVGVQAAKAIVPVKKGTLKNSIGIERVSIKRTDQIGLVQYGPKRKQKGFHGHLIEYGKTNRDGSKTPPNPFMETSYNQTKHQIEANIAQSLGRKVAAFMRRTIKNG